MSIPVAIAGLAAYLIGSIPFGLLTARAVNGIDIRQEGSGNIGATNVGRVLGAKWGMVVLLLDVLKGILPTGLLPRLVIESTDPRLLHVQVACGLCAIIGHMFPCWLRFRGGKGVATALGVILVLAPFSTLIAVACFVVTFALFRIVSLSSILAAVGFLVSVLSELQPTPFAPRTWSLAVFAIAVPVLIIMRHRGNLTRLLRGQEPRFRAGGARGAEEQSRAYDRVEESEPIRTSEPSD